MRPPSCAWTSARCPSGECGVSRGFRPGEQHRAPGALSPSTIYIFRMHCRHSQSIVYDGSDSIECPLASRNNSASQQSWYMLTFHEQKKSSNIWCNPYHFCNGNIALLECLLFTGSKNTDITTRTLTLLHRIKYTATHQYPSASCIVEATANPSQRVSSGYSQLENVLLSCTWSSLQPRRLMPLRPSAKPIKNPTHDSVVHDLFSCVLQMHRLHPTAAGSALP